MSESSSTTAHGPETAIQSLGECGLLRRVKNGIKLGIGRGVIRGQRTLQVTDGHRDLRDGAGVAGGDRGIQALAFGPEVGLYRRIGRRRSREIGSRLCLLSGTEAKHVGEHLDAALRDLGRSGRGMGLRLGDRQRSHETGNEQRCDKLHTHLDVHYLVEFTGRFRTRRMQPSRGIFTSLI